MFCLLSLSLSIANETFRGESREKTNRQTHGGWELVRISTFCQPQDHLRTRAEGREREWGKTERLSSSRKEESVLVIVIIIIMDIWRA